MDGIHLHEIHTCTDSHTATHVCTHTRTHVCKQVSSDASDNKIVSYHMYIQTWCTCVVYLQYTVSKQCVYVCISTQYLSILFCRYINTHIFYICSKKMASLYEVSWQPQGKIIITHAYILLYECMLVCCVIFCCTMPW